MFELLKTIDDPSALRKLERKQLHQLAEELRAYVLDSVSKTGALIRAAVLLGACCGGALEAALRARLDKYAKNVGLAFQVVDDVLDHEASTATLGKTAGKDSRQGKPTYVSVMGVARARELAQELGHNARQAVEPLGAGARRLRELADFIVLRKF